MQIESSVLGFKCLGTKKRSGYWSRFVFLKLVICVLQRINLRLLVCSRGAQICEDRQFF